MRIILLILILTSILVGQVVSYLSNPILGALAGIISATICYLLLIRLLRFSDKINAIEIPFKIAWGKIKFNFLILLLVIITIIGITIPIVKYSRNFQGSLSPSADDWGTFGDFFGGILNPFISLLTLIVTVIIAISISKIEKRNHDETVHSPVKPLFTIGTGDFYSFKASGVGPSFQSEIFSYKIAQIATENVDFLSKSFYLKLFNKGLGVADEVSIKFEINLNELKELLPITKSNLKISVTDVKNDGDGRSYVVANFNSAVWNEVGGAKILAVEKYGLGVIEKGKKMKARIPSQFITAFKLYNIKRKMDVPVGNFPDILVTLTYKNIHGKDLNSKFRLGLFPVDDYPKYSIFKILQENI